MSATGIPAFYPFGVADGWPPGHQLLFSAQDDQTPKMIRSPE
jgi:hypothetical protein